MDANGPFVIQLPSDGVRSSERRLMAFPALLATPFYSLLFFCLCLCSVCQFATARLCVCFCWSASARLFLESSEEASQCPWVGALSVPRRTWIRPLDLIWILPFKCCPRRSSSVRGRTHNAEAREGLERSPSEDAAP